MKSERRDAKLIAGHKIWAWHCPNRVELRARVERVREVWEGERVAAGRSGRLSQAAVIELALRLGLEAMEKHFGLITPGESGSGEGGGAGSDASSEL